MTGWVNHEVEMDLQLHGRTALITGASMGIGRGIALALAAEGVKLAVVARRRPLLEELTEEIVAAGGPRPVIIAVDIMDHDAAADIGRLSLDMLGGVEILINNAGGSRKLPVDAPEAAWEEAMTLNFTRVRQLTHALLPGMMARKWGRVVNISGKSEPEGLNGAFAAKAAIHAWAKGLSRDVGKFGITVNSIAPGRIISEQILRNYPPEERQRLSDTEIPVGENGQPADLAVLAVFLSSPLARYITGTVIPVDGGLRRYQF
jgi:3-oxoacyl-[acyl-carrier protein] reductase